MGFVLLIFEYATIFLEDAKALVGLRLFIVKLFTGLPLRLIDRFQVRYHQALIIYGINNRGSDCLRKHWLHAQPVYALTTR